MFIRHGRAHGRTPVRSGNQPSRQAVWLRELIAFGVQATGGDILATAKRYEQLVHSRWHPPLDWHYERITLPSGAGADYLAPPDCRHLDKAVLHLHGGAYILGQLPVFKRQADKLVRLCGRTPVLSLDYRVAPAHPYPAALNDAMEAVTWLGQHKGVRPSSIVAIGESAGAGLALALSMRLRDTGLECPCALVLMSPWADLTCRGESYESRYSLDPFFGRKRPLPDDSARVRIGSLYAGGQDLNAPYISPVFGDYNGLPPMLIHVGEYEMLLDDAQATAQHARAAGVDAQLKIWPGLFHAFQLAGPLIPEARQAWREIGVYIRRALQVTETA